VIEGNPTGRGDLLEASKKVWREAATRWHGGDGGHRAEEKGPTILTVAAGEQGLKRRDRGKKGGCRGKKRNDATGWGRGLSIETKGPKINSLLGPLNKPLKGRGAQFSKKRKGGEGQRSGKNLKFGVGRGGG